MRVFRANEFRPLAEGADGTFVSNGRRPAYRKHVVVLDGKFKLQPLAAIPRIGREARVGTSSVG